MSLVSVLPYGQTLDYWWEKLAGHPDRRRFMAVKVLEVSAFAPNGPHNARLARGATAIAFPPHKEPLPWPREAHIGVVVPMHARTASDRAMAQRLVRRLNEQTWRRASLVVVDDASPVPLDLDAPTIRLAGNQGPAHARNVGVAHLLQARPTAVAFTDMDCVPATDWLEGVAAGFMASPGSHILSGHTFAADRSWLGRYHELNGTLNGRRRDQGLLYGPTCNLALREEVCHALQFDPGFPTAAAEDIDFCLRARLQGWRIDHWAQMRVQHDFGYDSLSRPAQVHRLWRQFRRYAEGERRLLRAHPGYGMLFESTTEIPAELTGDLALTPPGSSGGAAIGEATVQR